MFTEKGIMFVCCCLTVTGICMSVYKTTPALKLFIVHKWVLQYRKEEVKPWSSGGGVILQEAIPLTDQSQIVVIVHR